MSRLVPYSNAHGAAPAVASGPHREGAPATRDPAPAGGTPAKDRLEAIAKFIPAEILAFYVPAVPAIELVKHGSWRPSLQMGAFLIAWLLVPVYFVWISGEDDRKWRQVALSTVAFPIWAYATNRNIGALSDWYDEALSVIALLVFTLATAFLLPSRKTP